MLSLVDPNHILGRFETLRELSKEKKTSDEDEPLVKEGDVVDAVVTAITDQQMNIKVGLRTRGITHVCQHVVLFHVDIVVFSLPLSKSLLRCMLTYVL